MKKSSPTQKTTVAGALLLLAALLHPAPAFAYIGPGAGFAFIGSAFVFIVTAAMVVVTVLFWPLQWLWRLATGKRISKHARTRRVVIVGLDGLSPDLVDRYIAEGKLPQLAALSREGSYARLQSTLPPISPVAWSTFQTGVNPGAHNIFDFLTRDKRFCLPQLSSTRTQGQPRSITFGPFRLPLGKSKVELLRKSQPFWKILGKHGIFSTILRVPISYPPEKFHGNVLAAMCVPDLKGTQGSFCVYTTDAALAAGGSTGGEVRLVNKTGNVIEASLEGPPNPFRRDNAPLRIPYSLAPGAEKDECLLLIGKERHTLKLNQFTPWIELRFRAGLGRTVSGIARFCLRGIDPHIFLYVSPINIHPERPVLPLSHPLFFSSYLAKQQGLYGTLGLLEDTWGRNEQVLDDGLFLAQTWDSHAEREAMFFRALEKTRQGVCACVFDASDRIQHMFWRYIDERHPAPREDAKHAGAIPEMYERMDGLIGKVRTKLKPDDVLIVMSDHGFASFRRCVNLNAWLRQEGYLAVKGSTPTGADYLQDVDWSKTRAFALGLGGIYLNRRGRERNGIVSDEEASALKREIIEKLSQLRDPASGERAVLRVHDAAQAYRGIYKDDAYDLVVGYAKGYRVSWESVTGTIGTVVFEDNMKAWSGDHGLDPDAVPGIFFSNRILKASDPHIMDIAPTVLDLFAVPVPGYMEGKVLL